ncbi:hypothetical protein QF041_003669 [Paenibacillus sp. W2I17]|nr:hypothetical protein [Paenibacillus sp. W2I17]
MLHIRSSDQDVAKAIFLFSSTNENFRFVREGHEVVLSVALGTGHEQALSANESETRYIEMYGVLELFCQAILGNNVSEVLYNFERCCRRNIRRPEFLRKSTDYSIGSARRELDNFGTLTSIIV